MKNCYICKYFNFITCIIENKKPCEGFPDKLPLKNEFIEVYYCEKYEPVKMVYV